MKCSRHLVVSVAIMCILFLREVYLSLCLVLEMRKQKERCRVEIQPARGILKGLQGQFSFIISHWDKYRIENLESWFIVSFTQRTSDCERTSVRLACLTRKQIPSKIGRALGKTSLVSFTPGLQQQALMVISELPFVEVVAKYWGRA